MVLISVSMAKTGDANIPRNLFLWFFRTHSILKVANGWGISYVAFFMFNLSRKAYLFSWKSSREAPMNCFGFINPKLDNMYGDKMF